jgi:hypothetical protein
MGQSIRQNGTIKPLADGQKFEVLRRRAPEPLHQVRRGVYFRDLVSQDRQRIAGLDAFQQQCSPSQVGIQQANGGTAAEGAKCSFLADELVVNEAKLENSWRAVGTAYRADVIRESIGEGRLESDLPALSHLSSDAGELLQPVSPCLAIDTLLVLRQPFGYLKVAVAHVVC